MQQLQLWPTVGKYDIIMFCACLCALFVLPDNQQLCYAYAETSIWFLHQYNKTLTMQHVPVCILEAKPSCSLHEAKKRLLPPNPFGATMPYQPQRMQCQVVAEDVKQRSL